MDAASGLNEAQMSAVAHGADGRSGPLIVLAGPGTGKTRVIVHRVARLIESGAEPKSVLAVTFTNKAAAQLRERLRELVGTAAADEVRASTFHSLGLSMVRRFASDLGLPPVRMDAAILDSAQRHRLLREAILRQGLFVGSRAAGLDAAVEFVAAQIRAMANAGKLPEDAAAFSQRWEQHIAHGVDSSGTALQPEEIDAERERHSRFAAAARAYQWFADESRERGWLGFDDLILYGIRLLRERAGAAAIVRSEMRHAVVDEFQDVNAGQIELLRLLFPPREAADGGDPPGPDLCVVGDDDQAIYGFRGADDQAFAKFARLWPGARQIMLSENYRSERAIIDAANHTIGLSDSRFAPEKRVERARLLTGAPPAAGAGVECVELSEESEAASAIAVMILTDRATGPVRDRPWERYAVVCRSNTQVSRVAAALRLEGIPVRASKPASLQDDDGVQDVLAFLELLANPAASWSARRLLVRPPLAGDAHAVMQIERRFRGELDRARHDGSVLQATPSFCAWLAQQGDLTAPIRSAVDRLLAWNAELAGLAAQGRAEAVIQRIVGLIGAAHADLLPGRERAQRVTALVALVRFARMTQARLDAPGDIREFWSYWNDLSDEDRSLGSAESIESRTQSDEDALDAGGAEAVADGLAVMVMTAHKAKGLEWDTVFVPNVSPTSGYGKAERRNPDGQLPAGIEEPEGTASSHERAEDRRVFYVACTRAERRLVLLAKRNKSPSKSVHFFEEFTRDPDGLKLVTIRPGAEVFSAAAAALGGTLSRAMSDRLDGEAETAGAFDRARRAARLAAAEALERVEAAGTGTRELDEAAAMLRGAAARLAVTAHVERERAVPAWAASASEPGLAEFARSLIEARVRDARAPSDAPRPPLSLSYTSVQAYIECPRCYWLRFVQGLPERERQKTATGSAVHKALEKFYIAVRAAESTGEPGPTLDDLLRLGREEFLAAWPRGEPIDDGQFEQTAAQLKLMLEKLHDPDGQVLEVEKNIRWDYAAEDPDKPGSFTTHKFQAKIDRIDQVTMPDGSAGFRVVDYKSGAAWKRLQEPPRDDLQLGIYAMALPHAVADVDLGATLAEYWLLSTGQKGSIRMSDLDLVKVRATIDGAVAGILAGHFGPDPKCRSGECLELPGPSDGPSGPP